MSNIMQSCNNIKNLQYQVIQARCFASEEQLVGTCIKNAPTLGSKAFGPYMKPRYLQCEVLANDVIHIHAAVLPYRLCCGCQACNTTSVVRELCVTNHVEFNTNQVETLAGHDHILFKVCKNKAKPPVTIVKIPVKQKLKLSTVGRRPNSLGVSQTHKRVKTQDRNITRQQMCMPTKQSSRKFTTRFDPDNSTAYSQMQMMDQTDQSDGLSLLSYLGDEVEAEPNYWQ
jgi:hypothetical protein